MENNSDYNQAYIAMVERNEKIIFSVCFFYSSSDLTFDDLRQEVLLSLYKAYPNFRGDCRESTWLYKVCINTCLLSIRRFSSKIHVQPIDELPHINPAEDSDSDLKEKLEWLQTMIAGLNPMDKALILMWLDELSYEEIALNMGIPRNTVASRLHRIKAKLSSQKEI